MTVIRSGWVLRPRIVMVLQPLTSQLCLIAIGWLLAQPMHVMADFPDLEWVAVVAPIGNSDHSSRAVVISIGQVVQCLSVSKKVFLKHHVN